MNLKPTKWLLAFSWRDTLKAAKETTYGLRLEAESLRSNCVLDCINKIGKRWTRIKQLGHKIKVKTIQLMNSRIYREEDEQEIILPNPVFSDNQASDIVKNYWYFLSVIVCLLGFES